MKLSASTIEALKSFSSINSSIEIREGSTLYTMSPSKTIVAKIEIPDSFEKTFCIYDLGQFLGVLGLFKEPELVFNDTFLTVQEGGEKINYGYGFLKDIVVAPKKEINFPDPDVSFDLTNDSLTRILKAAAVLGVPEVAVVGEDGEITVRALNVKEDHGNTYKFNVGSTDIEFRAVFKVEYLKLMPDDYKVEVASKGLAKFSSSKSTYFIAIEAASSKF